MKRILVVDDYPEIRHVIRIILQKAGYEILEAERGAEALEILKAEAAPSEVSAIVCDVSLMMENGIQAIDLIRREFPSIPIIGFTGTTDLHLGQSSFWKGRINHLVEPLESSLLIHAVQESVP